MTTTAAWVDALDEFEASLVRYLEFLEAIGPLADGDAEPPAAFEPPAGLGPVPDELRDRAVELWQLAEAVQASLEERAATTARSLAQLPRQRTPRAVTGRVFDQLA